MSKVTIRAQAPELTLPLQFPRIVEVNDSQHIVFFSCGVACEDYETALEFMSMLIEGIEIEV